MRCTKTISSLNQSWSSGSSSQRMSEKGETSLASSRSGESEANQGYLFERLWHVPPLIDLTLPHLCRYGYERELHALLVQLIRDMDRKIERQKDRAAKDSEPRALSEKEREQLEAIKVSSAPLACP